MIRFVTILLLLLPAALPAQNIPVISGVFYDELEKLEPILAQKLPGVSTIRVKQTDYAGGDSTKPRTDDMALVRFDEKGRIVEKQVWPNDTGAAFTVKTKWLAQKESEEETAPTKIGGTPIMTRTYRTYSYRTDNTGSGVETITEVTENGSKRFVETKTWSEDKSRYYIKTKDLLLFNDKSEAFRASDNQITGRTWMGERSEYFYDSLGWLKKIYRRTDDPSDPSYINLLVTHTKDAQGRKASTTCASESGILLYTETFSYDENGRLTQLMRREPDNQTGKLKPKHILDIAYESAEQLKEEQSKKDSSGTLKYVFFAGAGAIVLGIAVLVLRMLRRKKG